MRNADINFLCRSCTQELQNKLRIIKDTRPDFLKNLIFLEIKDKSLVELKEEYDIKIVLYLRCAKRHFGLFVKSTLFDKKGGYKNIVLENVVNNKEPLVPQDGSYLELPKKHFDQPEIVAPQANSLTPSSLNEANINFMKNIDYKMNQLGMMHLHNMKHMSKMRRNFLIVLLVLIVLAAAGLAGGLGFYFTISKEVATAVSRQNFNRVDLSEDVKNIELGTISDNKEATILAKVKTLNNNLVIDDILLKNITQTTAVLYPKSSSGHYKDSSSISVEYLATKISLKTHIHNQVIISEVNEPTKKQDILTGIKKENSQVIIQDLGVDLGTSTNSQADIFVNNSSLYIPDDKITVYFNTSGKKLIIQDLTEPNLGDLLDKKPDTILEALHTKNPHLIMNEIEFLNNSITNNEAVLVPKINSQHYIANEQIKVYYRVYNPNIGTIKKLVNKDVDTWSSFLQLSNGRILANGGYRNIYELNMDGTTKQELNLGVKFELILDMIQLQDGRVLLLDRNFAIYQLDIEHNNLEKFSIKINDSPRCIIQLQDGTILLGGLNGNIYNLHADGTIKTEITKLPNSIDESVSGLIEVKNDLFLAFVGNKIFQFSLNGTSKLITTISKEFSFFQSAIKLKDGTILAGGTWHKDQDNHFGGQLYQVNDDGTIKTRVSNDNSVIPLSFLQTSDGTVFMGSSHGIYELNNK